MKSLKQQGYYYGALLYAFLIPFPQKVINIAIILWLLLSLFGFRKSKVIKNRFLWLLPAFYFTYFIGLFTAETISFKFVEYKLSLLVFPLVFFLRTYQEKQRSKILKVFVQGLAASALTCLIMAVYNSIYFQNGEFLFQPNVLKGKEFMESILYGGNYFFGQYLSIFHQTVYCAMYLCTGVAILLFYPKLFQEKFRLALISVFIIFIFLVSNKASFIVLVIIFGIKICIWNTSNSKKLIGFSLFTFFIGAFILFNPRIKLSLLNAASGQLVINKEARYGFSTRLLSWDAAISLIKERPFSGYGYPDAQRVLNEKYEEKEYIYPLKESYNAHNLWFQSSLENGIFAIIILFAIFIALVKGFFNNGELNPLILSFVLILFVNSLFEGLFNRFSGISFFSFLVCFMFSKWKGDHLNE